VSSYCPNFTYALGPRAISSTEGSFDSRLALGLEAQFDEEHLGGFEIVDNDENVVHQY
jgi:hypothetical protein